MVRIEKGKQLNKELLSSNGLYPAYNGGISYSGFTDIYNYDENKIIISQGGASAGFVNFIKQKFYANAHCYVILPNESIVINKFIYYVLKNREIHLMEKQHGAGIPALKSSEISSLLIPIPPMRVQEEIVRILDEYTEKHEALKLELRKKQYYYYREKLLTFTNDTAEFLPLGELCDIKGRIGFRGYKRSDLVEKGEGAISLSPSDIYNQQLYFDDCKYISWLKYEESPEIMAKVGDIILTKTASIGKLALIKSLQEKATINPQLVLLKNIKCNPSYLYYILTADDFQKSLNKLAGVGSVPNIPQSSLAKIIIPIPPIAEQERIVSILDKFDSLVNSISEGIPAEINLRQKQYEYYRNALLSFN